MSYLNTDSSPVGDFTEAVISFWFRVPQSSLDALEARTAADFATPPYPRLAGVMPLVTFGQLFEGNQANFEFHQDDATFKKTYWQFNGPAAGGNGWQKQIGPPLELSYSTGSFYQQGEPIHVNPCYVGVFYDQNADPPSFFLRLQLQTKDKGSASWLGATTTNFNGDENYGLVTGQIELENPMSAWDGTICKTDSTAPGQPWISTATFHDATEAVLMIGPDAFGAGSQAMDVSPNEWHHALISFQLIPGSATGAYDVLDGTVCAPPITTRTHAPSLASPSKIWIAFDDVNYTGDDLRGNYIGFAPTHIDALGDNDMISTYTMMAYELGRYERRVVYWADMGAVGNATDSGAGAPSYAYPANPLPVNGQPFGIPAATNVMDQILHVEMAEFQMFTGIQVDTGDENVRRAFVDAEGKPVPPDKKASDKDPQSGSIEFLKQQPDILLHGSANWVKGKNTGSTGLDTSTPPKPIPSGQFTPVSIIKPYKPDPSLTGPQGAPQLARRRVRAP